jgi:hypothetical protein
MERTGFQIVDIREEEQIIRSQACLQELLTLNKAVAAECDRPIKRKR